MKKILASLGITVLLSMVVLGFASSAQAADYGDQGTSNSGTTPGSVSDGAAAASDGSLPNTGGPQTMLLAGGAALLVAGGTAVVVVRRRSNA